MPSLELAFISPGGGELVLIMLVLILLFGAQDAPRIFRTIHTLLDKLQRAAADFRYKIMYGDLHSKTTDEEPYDVEADYPDEDVQSSELHVQPASPKEAAPRHGSSEKEITLDAKNPETETENSELKS